jgi:hypothetical protein
MIDKIIIYCVMTDNKKAVNFIYVQNSNNKVANIYMYILL